MSRREQLRPRPAERDTRDALTRAATLGAPLAEAATPYKIAFYQDVARATARAETEVGCVVRRAAEGERWTRFAAAPPAPPFWSPEIRLEPGGAKALCTAWPA